jgi:hypothetical protein
VSLLEKAYAKLHGSYAAIISGSPLDALVDLTGFPTSDISPLWRAAKKNPQSAESKALFARLVRYDKAGHLVALSTPDDEGMSEGQVKRYEMAGLALGHAFTCISSMLFEHDDLRLMRIRNPWGNAKEFTGAWSDNDLRWKKFPDVAKACGFTASNDGTFWMTFEDALTYFDHGTVCHTQSNWFDYRVKGAFVNSHPNVVLEVTVTKTVRAYCILSQKDARGLRSSDPDQRYASALLSVVRPATSSNESRQRPKDGKVAMEVHLSTSTVVDEPAADDHAYISGRDLAMEYVFTPDRSPYFVLPRLLHGNISKGYTIGLVSNAGVGKGMTVSLVRLNEQCEVFKRRATFQMDKASMVAPTSAQYQVNLRHKAACTKEGSAIIM